MNYKKHLENMKLIILLVLFIISVVLAWTKPSGMTGTDLYLKYWYFYIPSIIVAIIIHYTNQK